ncbi:hypothetical protein MKW92_050924, partial [Papaver armeniacum]
MFPFSSGDSFVHVLWSSLPSIGRVADFWVSNGSKWKRHSHTIDLENFSQRLKAFYSHWRKTKLISGFPEIIMVFMDKQIHFLCSQKKASLLNEVKKSTKDTIGAETVMHVKVKNDDGTALMEDILQSYFKYISKSSDNGSPIVGYIAKEAPEGNLLELWSGKLKTSNLQLADVTIGFSELFAKAAYLSSSVMKHFVVPKLEKIIDEEKKVTHSSLMEETEKAVLEPAKVKVKLKADNVDICYPPIFQSGGESLISGRVLLASVIICVVGSRYNSYCSNVTMMQMQCHMGFSLRPRRQRSKVSAVYEAAFVVVLKDGPELVPNPTKIAVNRNWIGVP